ncbi:conserved Plasmodium protein, unknown function [Plasmodium knowlesi strain H]|uniref:Gamete antigen 27/25 n=3 Tax=Plasmodium knowlesi TaxID=5850 RepID=A0A5K1TZ18_PLAKH|nr:gamete antigen 27/25, putative [Plasmodium knowlesi strain H]OTN66877.1 Uncharacterized protein PKNOH_S08490400 [Plasmodium knowlesi]CAA9986825.1 gamete antigen 27/25, putative [Plasmodium knowlesi strain H]SBO23673.1 conserved Plasmodium protein, unknown function [Plasmodium knowlesi strain H]SBO25250.1 conserved Plasmodium protein, unknown function [Plasmodium knowlesi strain H]VVS76299.1 gamete antigen 27/25, putative [Plasmodium knowlesi strain H]|eukprot:XP_002258009.1 hypothetical protein, conserved in Plasmodium species [Plasmodium knowlesi strain H]
MLDNSESSLKRLNFLLQFFHFLVFYYFFFYNFCTLFCFPLNRVKMFKKCLVVISLNLLLKVTFNSSPFFAHALGIRTDRESSNVWEEYISVNYEPLEQDLSEACDYIALEEYSACGNISNEKSNNENDVEVEGSNIIVKNEERGTQTEEEEDEKVEGIYDEVTHQDDEKGSDDQGSNNELAGEYRIEEVDENVAILNENINSIHEMQSPLDSYKTIFLILSTEFDTTETYLNKIMNCSTDEEKNELLDDHIGILKEMYENCKKNENFRLPFEIRDSMALRISDRLRDFCFSDYVTESNMVALKSIFSIELEVFEGIFYYIEHKNTYREKKEVINDLELIKFYHEELITNNGLYLTDEQFDNAAMRVSNFVNDLYFLCFSNYQNMIKFREMQDAMSTYITL